MKPNKGRNLGGDKRTAMIPGHVRFSPVCVAYTLAEGEPPEWLLRSLEPREIGVDENGRVIKPRVSRKACAAIICQAWRRYHGSVEPSRKLYAVCRMYWGVCGGVRDFRDWRRPVERAL